MSLSNGSEGGQKNYLKDNLSFSKWLALEPLPPSPRSISGPKAARHSQIVCPNRRVSGENRGEKRREQAGADLGIHHDFRLRPSECTPLCGVLSKAARSERGSIRPAPVYPVQAHSQFSLHIPSSVWQWSLSGSISS